MSALDSHDAAGHQRHCGRFPTIETDHGLPGIITCEFEMPYRAEVVIMPEYPFELASRVRAVYYRPPRRDEE